MLNWLKWGLTVNRILLIGNGFYLSHGLKTSCTFEKMLCGQWAAASSRGKGQFYRAGAWAIESWGRR